ncbi:MAG: hypothetical protein LBK23_00030, partial [Oscillospiraceae bacterium]|nr:hypothetical protein [Oscillospiraceae bacterium]
GIIGGLLIAPIISKRIQKGALRVKLKDHRWSAYNAGTYMTMIVVVLTVPFFFHRFRRRHLRC